MRFEELNLSRQLLSALEKLGYISPTVIQERAFPIVMSGKDVCGIAQTGTGKTLAYLLPAIRQWKFSKQRSPQILVVVPTRELVMQVVETARSLTTEMNFISAGAFGGVNINTQAVELREGVDLLVATPGRLFDLVMNGAVKTKSIRTLVIDEVDEMLDQGFRTQLRNIIELLPPRRQNLLFSATITEEVQRLIDVYFDVPVVIEAAPTGTPVKKIRQSVYFAPNFNTKLNLLKEVLRDPAMARVLIFVATKNLADQLFERLEAELGELVSVIHSNKSQNYRFEAVNKFRDGATRFLIATDIIARGIDISEVSHVINFDLPEVAEQYMHRVGRTGRADKEGIAISLVNEKEKMHLAAIEALMNYNIPVLQMPPEVAISDELTTEEMPKVLMKTIQLKVPAKEESGPAFHPKSAKNSKVNHVVSRKDKMMRKYGKPKTRGSKKR